MKLSSLFNFIKLALLVLAMHTSTIHAQTLSGTIKDAGNGEDLPSVMVTWTSSAGTSRALTNSYGYFVLNLPGGTKEGTLSATFIGYEPYEQAIQNAGSKRLTIKMKEAINELGAATVTGAKLNENITTTQMSVNKISSKQIKKIPQFLGEADVIRSLTLLPGVTTVGEGASGFNVRGGNADQNLILLDQAPVYNSSHLFGFFSIFNSDAVSDLTLYKGGMPSRYGGRLSSVLDVRQKEGNSEQFTTSGGIGLLSSRLMVEGPISDNVSAMIAGRRSYFDLFFPLFDVDELDQTSLYFYDLNAKVNAKLGENDRLFASAYFGRDKVSLGELFAFGWGNWTGTLRWNHTFGDRLFMNTSYVYSDYTYELGSPEDSAGNTDFLLESRIQNHVSNMGFTWFANQNHTVEFGIQNTYYDFNPGNITGQAFEVTLQEEFADELAFYVSDDWKINDRLSLSYGLRYSSFFNLGARDVRLYDSTTTIISDETATGFESYEDNEIIRQFTDLKGLEPRLALNYRLTETSAFKLSYNRNRQYIHLISNTTSATPVDVWRPAGTYIEPATVNQIATGWNRNWQDGSVRFSMEGYYKTYESLVDYKNGADLIFSEYIETELLTGEGRSYGVEFLLEKKLGKLTGWAAYTLGRSELRVQGDHFINTINNGNWYPSNYDKLHDFTLVANYQITPRWDVSANFVYMSGRAITYPDGRGEFEGITYPVYSNRNGARTPPTHRLDLGATYQLGKDGNAGSLAFGAYNVYARHNPYSVFFQQDLRDPTNISAWQLSILATIVPYLTYNFKF